MAAPADSEKVAIPAKRPPRRNAQGYLWWILTALAGVVLWQSIFGAPIKRREALPGFDAGVVVKQRLPSKCPNSRWYFGQIRVTEGDMPIRWHASRDTLAASDTSGYAIYGKSLHLFRKDAGSGQPWVVEFPWVPRGWQLLLLCAISLAWGIFLRAKNEPIAANAFSLAGGRLTGRGYPYLTLTAAAVAIIAAIALRVYGFSFPNWANDTLSHYRAVFAVAMGGHPSVTPDRPFGLPVIMGLILRLFGDLRAVVAAQGFATIFAGAALGMVVWLSAWRFPAAMRGFCRLMAVLAFAALAFNESILEREWALLAEIWVAFYFGSQVLLAWYLPRQPHPLWRAAIAYTLFCLAGLMAFFTRPNWGLAVALLPVPWMVASLLYQRGGRLAGWLGAGAAVLLAAVAVAFGYQRHCSQFEGMAVLYERSRALVSWHVPLVRREIDRRLAASPPDRYKSVLIDVARVMDAELERAKEFGPGYYPSIGYDADHLYFDSLPSAPEFRKLPLGERAVLCSDLFKGALLRNPLVYVRKVLWQMPSLFAHPYDRPRISVADVQEALAKSRDAAANTKEIPPRIAENYRRTLAAAEVEFERGWPSRARLAMSLREGILFEWLTASFAWCIGIPLIIAITAVCWPRWRGKVPWRVYAPPLTVAVWSLGSILLSALTAALVQGLDIQRYLELFTPLTVLCQVLWPLLGLAMICEGLAKTK